MAERIGDFLVRIGAISKDQVEAVLRIQKTGDKRPFGEIALELRYISDDSITRYVGFLESQRSSESAGAEIKGE